MTSSVEGFNTLIHLPDSFSMNRPLINIFNSFMVVFFSLNFDFKNTRKNRRSCFKNDISCFINDRYHRISVMSILYHKADINDTIDDLLDGSMTIDEVDGFVDANIADVEKRLAKSDSGIRGEDAAAQESAGGVEIKPIGKGVREQKASGEHAVSEEESILRDALVDVVQRNGIEVVTDNEAAQKVLDEANGEARMSAKQKRALVLLLVPIPIAGFRMMVMHIS